MPVQLIDCIFEANTATGNGGAVGSGSGYATIKGCRFTGNVADRGGAVDCGHGLLAMESCTFAGNSSTDGGALFLSNVGELELLHCTFYGNAAARGGAISMVGTGSGVRSIATSILAFGPEGEGFYWDGTGPLDVNHLDIYGNVGGDWVGSLADQLGVGGNVSLDPLFCDAEAGEFTLREDSPCLPAGNPDGVQIGAHGQGCEVITGVAATATPPAAGLLGAHPNPFNPSVTIRFEPAVAGRMALRVFGSDGSLVAVLADRHFEPGPQQVVWDGRDSRGRPAASGVYHAVLAAPGARQALKLVLLR